VNKSDNRKIEQAFRDFRDYCSILHTKRNQPLKCKFHHPYFCRYK